MRTPRVRFRGVLGIVVHRDYDLRYVTSELHATRPRLILRGLPPAPAVDISSSPVATAGGTTDGGMTKQPSGQQAWSAYWTQFHLGRAMSTLNPTPNSISVQSSPASLALAGGTSKEVSWI